MRHVSIASACRVYTADLAGIVDTACDAKHLQAKIDLVKLDRLQFLGLHSFSVLAYRASKSPGRRYQARAMLVAFYETLIEIFLLDFHQDVKPLNLTSRLRREEKAKTEEDELAQSPILGDSTRNVTICTPLRRIVALVSSGSCHRCILATLICPQPASRAATHHQRDGQH